MKLFRIVHKNLNYHIKRVLWLENKNVYFLYASKIYHDSILLKIERKSGKYLISWQEYIFATFSFQNDA